MANRYLYLKGCAGLGNRLITLVKAIDYAKRTNRQIYVDWSDGMFDQPGVNAFYKYFDLKTDVAVVSNFEEIEHALVNGASIYPKTLDAKGLRGNFFSTYNIAGTFLSQKVPFYRVMVTLIIHGKICSVFGLQSWQRLTDKEYGWKALIKKVYNEDNVMFGAQLPKGVDRDIVTFIDFRPLIKMEKIFRYIKLNDKYAQKFRKFAEKEDLVMNAIGVHIRATDKQPKKQIGKLLLKLDAKLCEKPSLNIFLCTDNMDIQDEMEKRYKGKIISYPKFMPKDVGKRGLHNWALDHPECNISARMFEDSLADMWILSMCKFLYWQGNSSFSMVSKLIKNDSSTTIDWMK